MFNPGRVSQNFPSDPRINQFSPKAGSDDGRGLIPKAFQISTNKRSKSFPLQVTGHAGFIIDSKNKIQILPWKQFLIKEQYNNWAPPESEPYDLLQRGAVSYRYTTEAIRRLLHICNPVPIFFNL